MPQLPDLVVGIDLGTTNSSIAAVVDDQVVVIPIAGKTSMPSAVGLDAEGKLIVGQAAKNQAIAAPERTVLSIKRLMGTDNSVVLGDKTYRPEEISAIILGELKRAAEAHLGRDVTHAVITVPAFFNERQRQATQAAGELAGLNVQRIINEPTAAALAYGAGTKGGADTETLLVYDLGGGTFDVSLVTVDNGVVEVRASHGDTELGGDDFDLALAAHAESLFGKENPEAASPLPDLTRRRLKNALEAVKISLTDQPYAELREEYLTETAHLEVEVSRMEYEEMIAPLLERTLESLQRSLNDAGVSAAEVDKIMLVGGATRTPLVGRLLEDRLNKEPRHEINPDLIVAMGAAIQGAALAGQSAPAILIDITAHTYSMKALTLDPDGFGQVLCCVPIIRRGTPLPVRKSEGFSTVHDGQEAIDVVVFQGESMWPEENLELGNFRIDHLGDVPAGNELIVEFNIDLNGLLRATATEKRTGMARSLVIDTGDQHRFNLDEARSNLASLFGGSESDLEEDETPGSGGDSASHALVATAKSLRRRAEALMERGVAEADKDDLLQRLERLSGAIKASQWDTLEAETDQLSDVLFYLED
ncbi:MAG: Hsp70 family protein [Verrucomicrobiales bacterium]|nr:Hsp70 family protein [Verrucomicrobiales bacterium]